MINDIIRDCIVQTPPQIIKPLMDKQEEFKAYVTNHLLNTIKELQAQKFISDTVSEQFREKLGIKDDNQNQIFIKPNEARRNPPSTPGRQAPAPPMKTTINMGLVSGPPPLPPTKASIVATISSSQQAAEMPPPLPPRDQVQLSTRTSPPKSQQSELGTVPQRAAPVPPGKPIMQGAISTFATTEKPISANRPPPQPPKASQISAPVNFNGVEANVSVDSKTAASVATKAVTSGAAGALVSGMKPTMGPNGIVMSVDPKAATKAAKAFHESGATNELINGATITMAGNQSESKAAPTGMGGGAKLSDMIARSNSKKHESSKFSTGPSLLDGLPAAPPRVFTKSKPSPGLPPPLYSINEKKVRAVRDYSPEDNDVLGFKAGDEIIFYSKVDENWFEGKIGDRRGIFPVNFVVDTQVPRP